MRTDCRSSDGKTWLCRLSFSLLHDFAQFKKQDKEWKAEWNWGILGFAFRIEYSASSQIHNHHHQSSSSEEEGKWAAEIHHQQQRRSKTMWWARSTWDAHLASLGPTFPTSPFLFHLPNTQSLMLLNMMMKWLLLIKRSAWTQMVIWFLSDATVSLFQLLSCAFAGFNVILFDVNEDFLLLICRTMLR